MAKINVKVIRGEPHWKFNVTVRHRNQSTDHQVTMKDDLYRQVTAGKHSATKMVSASFRFLLDRESKESILPQFDLSVISRYFPEYETTLREYL